MRVLLSLIVFSITLVFAIARLGQHTALTEHQKIQTADLQREYGVAARPPLHVSLKTAGVERCVDSEDYCPISGY